jgi:hypothetical protein
VLAQPLTGPALPPPEEDKKKDEEKKEETGIRQTKWAVVSPYAVR